MALQEREASRIFDSPALALLSSNRIGFSPPLSPRDLNGDSLHLWLQGRTPDLGLVNENNASPAHSSSVNGWTHYPIQSSQAK